MHLQFALSVSGPEEVELVVSIINSPENVTCTIENLEAIAPDASVNITIEKTDGETKDIKANHSLSDEQIEWFKAGSALNLIAKQNDN